MRAFLEKVCFSLEILTTELLKLQKDFLLFSHLLHRPSCPPSLPCTHPPTWHVPKALLKWGVQWKAKSTAQAFPSRSRTSKLGIKVWEELGHRQAPGRPRKESACSSRKESPTKTHGGWILTGKTSLLFNERITDLPSFSLTGAVPIA